MDINIKVKAKSFKNTFCVFNEVDINEIEGLKLSYQSESGSKYFYTNDGMFRLSNHWGRLANSKWRLEPSENRINDSKFKLGFAHFSSFLPDNKTEKLYYLEYNEINKTINYQHKLNPNYDSKAILRTADETTKRIKQARNILILTNWAKHFDYDDLDILRQKIVKELIYTDDLLETIKQKFYE